MMVKLMALLLLRAHVTRMCAEQRIDSGKTCCKCDKFEVERVDK